MLTIPYAEFLPIDLIVDCEDLAVNLNKPAVGAQTDLSMAVYLSALRHDRKTGRLRHIFWVPTDMMLANIGTKLTEDGLAVLGDVPKVLTFGQYNISVEYRFNGTTMHP